MPSPSSSAAACNAALLPLAACAAALWAYFSLAPFTPSGLDWKLALSGLFDHLGEGFADNLFVHMLMALSLGFLWQGVFWPRGMAGRLAAGVVVLVGLLVWAVLVAWGQLYFKPGLVHPGGLLGTLLGVGVGMGLWWGGGATLMRRLPCLPGGLWPGMVLLALLFWALPLVPERSLGDPVLVQGAAMLTDLPQRFYQLIKGAMLWVPVSFIFALAGQRAGIPRWGMALAVAPLLVGVPVLGALPLSEILELAAALPGLWLGAWLGEQTRLSAVGLAPVPLPAGGRAASNQVVVDAVAQPVQPVAEGRGAGSRYRPERRPEIAAEAAPTAEVAADENESRRGRRVLRPHPAGIALGVGLLALALLGVVDFSRWQWLIGLGLVLYAGALWRWPLAWLVAVPAALPLLDLAPWTGRYFLDEFDLLMLVTAGVLFLRGGRGRPVPLLPGAGLLMAGLGLSALVSLLVGIWPLPALDANAFSSYWSPYNALRVAKGFLWGGLILLWWRQARAERQVLAMRLAWGMGLGLLGVGLIGAWEHHLFVGFEDRLETYRIVSTFSSMHTGGGHIEAYLVAALPFLWLATAKFRHLAFTAPVMLLTAYVMLYTVARGGVLALGVVLVILMVASVRLALRARGRRFVAPVAVLVAVGMVLAAGVGVGYFQHRFTQTGQDWQTRVDHWSQTLDMVDDTWLARLFGMGLGSFPRTYQERGPVDKQPTSFGFATEQGNTFFRLGTGETVYYAQRIPFSAGRSYRLELDLRSRQGDTRLDTPVCEKQLLNSRQCEWFSFNVPGDGAWHRQSHVFASTKVGAENGLNRPPVELFLYHPGKEGVVDVDNLRLLDPEGRDVLCNGNFSRGGDCWFFKTHSHLPWHIKNVWVHVLFEQGWVGLLLFATLMVVALSRLARAGWRGHRLAWAWLASLAGLLVVGMFDSLLDTPRLATLLMVWMLLGASYDWEPRERSSERRRSKTPSHHKRDRIEGAPVQSPQQ
jgi:hypothetical protein